MKYIVHVEVEAMVEGALSVEANSPQEAEKKAALSANEWAYWGRPKVGKVTKTEVRSYPTTASQPPLSGAEGASSRVPGSLGELVLPEDAA